MPQPHFLTETADRAVTACLSGGYCSRDAEDEHADSTCLHVRGGMLIFCNLGIEEPPPSCAVMLRKQLIEP